MPSVRRLNEYGEVVAGKLVQEQRQLGDKEIIAAIAGYRDGRTTYELAEQFGCHRITITDVLKKNGVTVTKSKSSVKLDHEDVIAMYTAGHTSFEIANKYEVSYQTVTKCLKANGVAIRGRWG